MDATLNHEKFRPNTNNELQRKQMLELFSLFCFIFLFFQLVLRLFSLNMFNWYIWIRPQSKSNSALILSHYKY